jgi:hypothetical protein
VTAPRPENPKVRYEKEDINARSTFWFGLWILLIMVAVSFLIKPLYDLLVTRNAEGQPPAAYAGRVNAADLRPPAPRLQVTPSRDLWTFRSREDAVLGSYAWVDKDRGIVRIPIEEAMRIAAERGIPTFSAPEAVAPERRPR